MIAILDEFCKLTEKDVSSKTIWDRLEKLYDMETLVRCDLAINSSAIKGLYFHSWESLICWDGQHENENLPFPTNIVPFTIEGNKEFDEIIAKLKTGTETNKSDKPSEAMDETEVSPQNKSGIKGKNQELNKSNAKVKTENEKSKQLERKEENSKQSEKSDDNEEKGNRSKKQTPKGSAELRSAQSASAAKKRK